MDGGVGELFIQTSVKAVGDMCPVEVVRLKDVVESSFVVALTLVTG